jgi:hypothetical protein
MACEEESADCRAARADYENANRDFLRAGSDIRAASDNRNIAVAATGLGTAVAIAGVAMANPVAGFLGGLVAGASVGFAAFFTGRLNRARELCRDALAALLVAYSRAAASCRDPDCVPPQPSDACS